jgi:predicted unusual protein kinase regulating ubiquinone biosynthesis (AarF/ABC1/UbiB family)
LSDDNKISSGRFTRLAKLASLTARTAGDLAVGRAKRAMGDTGFESEKAAAMKVLQTLGTMKGAAMKLGQQLAMDADALPEEAREIITKLFAQAPRASDEDIARVVEEELGAPPEKAFATFEKEPLASASLGQVHRATLPDGRQVAVKVQYPGVAEALKSDLQNASLLVSALNGASKAIADFDTRPYYEELRREIGAESDYLREAQMGARFAAAVAPFPELHVPAVIPERSTARVLTTELVQGVRLDQFQPQNAEDRFRVGRQLVLAIFGPVLTRGITHGDPHPGNFLVRPDGRLTVLDFGAVKQLSDTFVTNFWEILRGELEGRRMRLIDHFMAAGFTVRGDRELAERTMQEMHVHAAAPVRLPRYDWATGGMVSSLRDYGQNHLRAVTAIQAPPESLLFYRALQGLAGNLKLLKAEGPFREVVQELDTIRRAHAAA